MREKLTSDRRQPCQRTRPSRQDGALMTGSGSAKPGGPVELWGIGNRCAMFADGGYLASKPYAASGAYIDRMSDYCGACVYRVKHKAGLRACPFNYLYWDFLIRNGERLSRNPRLEQPYRLIAKMSDARRREIAEDSARFLSALS